MSSLNSLPVWFVYTVAQWAWPHPPVSRSREVRRRRRPSSSSAPCLAPRCSGSAGSRQCTWAPAARWQPCWDVPCSRRTGSAGNTSASQRMAAQTPPGGRRTRRTRRSQPRSWTGLWSRARRQRGRHGVPWRPDPAPGWTRRSSDQADAARSGCPARCCRSPGSPPAAAPPTWWRPEEVQRRSTGQEVSAGSD